jgi:hypothetical protein
MSNIKCFGCSYTKYKWNTWPHFLKLSAHKHNVYNFGLSGSSNEFICREIIKHSRKNDKVVVMWSTFDRTHSEVFLQKNKFNPGKKDDYTFGVTLEQLYQRTLEYIWLANRYCEDNNIKVVNLAITILELGETQQYNKFNRHLDIKNEQWPIDFDSFCLENPGFVPNGEDTHPLPSQHYAYNKDVICPLLNLQPRLVADKHLKKLDLNTKENHG